MSTFLSYGKMQESGLTEIIFLICTSATWDQYPALLHLESPPGYTVEGNCSRWGIGSSRVLLSPSWIPSGLTIRGGCSGLIAVTSFVFLIWQAIFVFIDTLVKEAKEDLNKWKDIKNSWIGKHYYYDGKLPKLFCRFKAIPIKNPGSFFVCVSWQEDHKIHMKCNGEAV